jgi:RecB family exonuclease
LVIAEGGIRPTSLSVSQLSEYGECAKRWHLKKALKVPFQRGLALMFGSAVHAGLETFNYDHFSELRVAFRMGTPPPDAEEPGPINMDHVFKMFEEEFDDQLTDDALEAEHKKIQRQKNSRKALKKLSLEAFKTHIVDELKEIGRDLLQQYHDRDDHGDTALFIEKEDKVEIAGLPFRLIADLVDVKGGKIRLRDYKTRAKSDKTIARMQLVAYSWILEEFHGIKVDEVCQMNFLKTVSNPRIEVLPYDMAEYQKDVALFKTEVDTFLRGTSAGIFPRHISPFCTACGVKEVCDDPTLETQKLEEIRREDLGLLSV